VANLIEIGAALRAWRDRVSPDEVGLPSGGRRRAPGLRREELAALAGVSVDYLVRLEQGRAVNPSGQVLASLTRALRLSVPERDMLYRAAGVAPPSPGTVSRHVSAGMQRILDRLGDIPVAVYTASWEVIQTNPLWRALFGERAEPTGRDRNLVWRFFVHDRTGVLRDHEEYTRFAEGMVADLRDTAARYPSDRELATMISELRDRSSWFEELWQGYAVNRKVSERKTILSPIGAITLDCDVMTVPDSDVRVVVYTARPGTEDADKLDLLRVTGLQTLSGDRAR
jgi:transcriptional regulator with XRE-family HTH domain